MKKINYIFVMNYDGVFLSHANENFIGKNFKELNLKISNEIGDKIINIAKKW